MKNKILVFTIASLILSSNAHAEDKSVLQSLRDADGALADILSPASEQAFVDTLEYTMDDLANEIRSTRSVVAERSTGAAYVPQAGRTVALK